MAQIISSLEEVWDMPRMSWNEYEGRQEAEYFDDREKLLERLAGLCEEPKKDEEDIENRIIFRKSETEKYLASPAVLALILEEYELADRLLDAGYCVNECFLDIQALGHCNEEQEWKYENIYVTQLLIGKQNIPDALFKRLCEEMTLFLPAFRFLRDYWENPFIPGIIRFHKRGKPIPTTKGLDRIYDFRPELLEGFIDRPQMVKLRYGLECLKAGEKRKIVWKLMQYVWDYEEDFRALLELFELEFPRNYDKKEISENFKMLFWIYDICACSLVMRKVLFEYLILQLATVIESRRNIDKEDYKYYCEELFRLAKDCKPEDYDFEEYLESFMLKESYWQDSVKYVLLWRRVTDEPMELSRMNGAFWEMIQEIIGRVYEEDEFSFLQKEFDQNDREYERKIRIQTLTALMEQPLVFKDVFKNTKAQKNAVAVLFSGILDFGSEELVIACMRNQILPKELLPKLISAALALKKLKVVPAMIVHQNLEN